MKNKIIITDGIINEPVFSKEPVRLLWILKEANDTESTEGWDMRMFLRERSAEKGGLFSYNKCRSTFGLICKISYGILDPKFTYEEICDLDDESFAGVLDRVSHINIKKVPGGSIVDYELFNEYINNPENMEEVKQQIKDIKPHIVICGNTFQYLFPDINSRGFDFNKDWIYEENGIKYINGWHPNVRIDHESYFNDVKRELHLYESKTK